MRGDKTPLADVLARLGDQARRENRPLPIIETDRATAHHLADMLASEIFDDVRVRHDNPETAFGIVAMFDGVKIKWKR
jgi:hypothetical protein